MPSMSSGGVSGLYIYLSRLLQHQTEPEPADRTAADSRTAGHNNADRQDRTGQDREQSAQ